MALSTELLNKLKLNDVPLEDKLSIAKILFTHSEFCFINRKEDLVLEWLLEMTNSEFKKDVWETIRDCLLSENMKNLKVFDVKSEIKETFVKILIHSLKSLFPLKTSKEHQKLLLSVIDDDIKVRYIVQECSFLVLESVLFQYLFKKNIKKYLKLSHLVLKSAVESEDIDIFIRYIKSVGCFCVQIKKEESFKIFVEKLLLPILETFCSMKEFIHSRCLDNSRELNGEKMFDKNSREYVRREVVHLIGLILFPMSIFKSFKHDLILLFKNDFISNSLSVLCSFLGKHTWYHCNHVTVELFSMVFEACVQRYKKDFNTIYRFCVTLCSLLGMNPFIVNEETNEKSCLLSKKVISSILCADVSDDFDEESLLVVKELIITLKKGNVVLDEIVNGISFKQWMQALVIELLTSDRYLYVTLDIVNAVIDLNPLIFEPVLNQILYIVVLKPKRTEIEKESYKLFFHGMFNIFVKLQQIEKFIGSNLLPALKQAIENEKHAGSTLLDAIASDVIPSGIDISFSTAVGMIPGTSSVSLLGTISDALNHDVITPMKTGKFDGGHRLLLLVLENILVSFLGGVKLADQSVPEVAYTSFIKKFGKLRTHLGRLGPALLNKEHCSESLASFLRICRAVGEVQMLLLMYSPWSKKSTDLQVSKSVDADNVTNFQMLLSFLSPSHWNAIAERVTCGGDASCQEGLNALMLQQLRCLVVFGSHIENSKEMQTAVCNYLFESLKGIQIIKKSPIITILLPFLSEKEAISVADDLVEQFLIDTSSCEISVLLKDLVIQENKTLLAALTWTAMQKISKMFCNRKRAHDSEHKKCIRSHLLRDLLTTVKYSHLLSHKKKMKHYLEISQKINEACIFILGGDRGEVSTNSSLEVDTIHRYLLLLCTLPLPFLPQNTQTFLMLGMVCVVVMLSGECQKLSANNFSRNPFIILKTKCMDILLGIADSPVPSSLPDIVDIGLVLRLLHYEGQCPRLLMQRLFEVCAEKPEHLQKLAESVCLADQHVELKVNSNSPLIAALLLRVLKNKNLDKLSEESREIYECNILYLVNVIAECIYRRMKEHISETKAISLLEAYWGVMSSHSKEMKEIVTHAECFMSAAFSVLDSSDSSKDAIDTAENLLEVFVGKYAQMGQALCERALWRVYKSAERPDLTTRLLKVASQESFQKIIVDFCQSLNERNNGLVEFPDLRLPSHLVTVTMPDSKADEVEKLVALVCTTAFARIMHGDVDDKLPHFLSFLFSIVRQRKVRLDHEFIDIILTTAIHALKAQPIPLQGFLNIGPTIHRLLLMLVLHHFLIIEHCIPSFLQAYKMLIQTVIDKSSVGSELKEEELDKLSKCAMGIEQISDALIPHSIHFKVVSQYLVADLLQELERAALHQKVKIHLMNCLYAFIELCDEFAIKHLSYALPRASLELFKTAKMNYGKFYKYKGKV